MEKEENVKQVIELERIIKVLNKERKYEEKVQYCVKGLELDEENIYFLSNLGFYNYYTLGDYTKAYEYFKKSIEFGDMLPSVLNAYFACAVKIDKIPDGFDVYLLKSHFNNFGRYEKFHLVLIDRIIHNCDTIDPDLIMFYMLNAIKKKKFENVMENCEWFVKHIDNNSAGLKALECVIWGMKKSNNLDKFIEYSNLYKNMVYEFPERINKNRIDNINSYNQYIEKRRLLSIPS